MVRLKIAYWEFDFEAVYPTLDHDLLSQAHMCNMCHNLLPHSGILSVSVYICFLLQYLLPSCTWYFLTEHPISHLAKRLPQYAPQPWLLKFPINLWSTVQTDNQHHHLFTTYFVSFYCVQAQTQQACGLGEPGWQRSPA